MRELPGKEHRAEEPPADAVLTKEHIAPCVVSGCCGLARCRDPAHQRRDAADDGADPGVYHVHPFERGVDERVKDDVAGGEGGDGGVCPDVEEG